MSDSFDAIRYIGYLGARWRGIAGSVAIATLIALGVSLAIEREYTATARIVIEPPAGMDSGSGIRWKR
jgi:uncharacterized protein involved in exopolysaccharide biosynthesis